MAELGEFDQESPQVIDSGTPARQSVATHTLSEPFFFVPVVLVSLMTLLCKHFTWIPRPTLNRYAVHIRDTLGLTEPIVFVAFGGFGIVFKSADQLDDGTRRPIAVKLQFTPAWLNENKELARFKQETDAEVEMLFKIKHPHIVSGIKVVRIPHPQRPSMPLAVLVSTEYLPATLRSLFEVPRRVKLNLRHLKPVVAQVGSGLVHLMRSNVVHRDLKPSNIMAKYPEGIEKTHVLASSKTRYMIIDLGTARKYNVPARPESTVKLTSMPVGTELYLPLELKAILNNYRTANPRVNPYYQDSYSFGLILVSMILGHKKVESALDRGQSIHKLWCGHFDQLVQQLNEDGLPLRNRHGHYLPWAKPVEAALKAIADLVQDAPFMRRFVDEELLAIFDKL